MLMDFTDFLYGGGNRVQPEKKDIWKVVLFFIVIFGTIVLYVFEFDWFDRIFDVGDLLIRGAIIGVIVGFEMSRRWTKNLKTTLEKVQVAVFVIVLCGLLFPLLASLSNRLLSYHKAEDRTVEFISLKPTSQQRFGLTKDDLEQSIEADAYHLFFVYKEKVVRIEVDNPYFYDKKQGDMIKIPIQKGLWGYEFVPLN